MRAFTTYWKNKTWDGNPERGGLRHTASNEFRAHGVKAGDRVYITTIRDGQLYVGARLTVKKIVTRAEAQRLLKDRNLWDSKDHIIATRNEVFHASRQVLTDSARQLRFVNGGRLKFRSATKLDHQTLRTVRELTPASARVLDAVLQPSAATEVEEPEEREAEEAERAIRKRRDITATQKETLVQARRGQGRFRGDLERVESRCRVTGLTQLDLLRASHIKPWAKCSNRERLDPNNGLLLAPHVDVLFELGYITFTGNGRLNVSKRLDPAVARAWRLKAGQSVGTFSKAQKSYLTYHRRLRFKR
jgi:hypothetical protein